MLRSLSIFLFFISLAAQTSWAGDEPVLSLTQTSNLADARVALGQITTGYNGALQATPAQVDFFQNIFRFDQAMSPLMVRYRCALGGGTGAGLKVLYAGAMSEQELRAARTWLGSKNYADQLAALMTANPKDATRLGPVSSLAKLKAQYDQAHPNQRTASLSVPELAESLGSFATERYGMQIPDEILIYDLTAERVRRNSTVLNRPADLQALLSSVATKLSPSSKLDLAQLVAGNLRSPDVQTESGRQKWQTQESSALVSLGYALDPQNTTAQSASSKSAIRFHDPNAPGTQLELGLGSPPRELNRQSTTVNSPAASLKPPETQQMDSGLLSGAPHVTRVTNAEGQSIFFGRNSAGAQVAGVVQAPPSAAPNAALPTFSDGPSRPAGGLNSTVDLGRGQAVFSGGRENKDSLGRAGSTVNGGVTAAVPLSAQGAIEVRLGTTVNSRSADSRSMIDPLGDRSDIRHAARAKTTLGPMTATVEFENQSGDVGRVDNRSKSQALKLATTLQAAGGQLELRAESADTRNGADRQNVVTTSAAYSRGDSFKAGVLFGSTRSLSGGAASSEQRLELSAGGELEVGTIGTYKLQAMVGGVIGSAGNAASSSGLSNNTLASRALNKYAKVEVTRGAYVLSASHDQNNNNTVLLVYKIPLQ